LIDGDIQRAVKAVLDDGFSAFGYPNIIVAQSFQPTKQGVPLDPIVYFTKINAQRYGFQSRKNIYNDQTGFFDHSENYFLEANYQINAVIKQDISDPNSVNAYDIVDLSAAILQTERARQFLLDLGIGILRITSIRTPRYLNSSDNFDIDPSFDFTLVYQNTINYTVDPATITGTVEGV
jgi:hypothetical protein